jgi:RNA polymerase sigma factor (sigma-70 family)
MGQTYDWLRRVAEQHSDWVAIVRSFGEYTYAEDLVQEAYLALIKYANEEKLIKNGKVSRGYMFFTLRSLYYQYYNKKKRIDKVSLDDDENYIQVPYEDNIEENEAFHKICNLVDNVSDEWSWYDRKLWKLYSRTDMSMRKLASETKISWVSIYNTLKHLKKDIREKLDEDWQDYKNKDYDKL